MPSDNGKPALGGEWFLIRDGEEFGPCSPIHIKQLGARGSLLPSDGVKFPDGRVYSARQFQGLIPSQNGGNLSIEVEHPDSKNGESVDHSETANDEVGRAHPVDENSGDIVETEADDLEEVDEFVTPLTDQMLDEFEILDESADVLAGDEVDSDEIDSKSTIIRTKAFTVDQPAESDDEVGYSQSNPAPTVGERHPRGDSLETIKSVLLVDFDAVTQAQGEHNGSVFGEFKRDPKRVIDWIEHGMPGISVERRPRRVLRAVCFGDSTTLSDERGAFVNAGIQFVDCPCLPDCKLNAAGVAMTIDVIDSLRHETRFDEFILVVGNVDLRPVLTRLIEHDRRTTVVFVESVIDSWCALSDQCVRLDDFLLHALATPRNNTAGADESRPSICDSI